MRSVLKSVIAIGVWWPAVLGAYPNAPICAVHSDSTPTQSIHQTIGLQPNASDAPMCLPPQLQIARTDDNTLQATRIALEQARLQTLQGDLTQARMHLRVAEWAMPHLEDRFALRRAELLMKEQRFEEACRAYSIATGSPESTTVVLARVGQTRCLLEAADRRALKSLNDLLKHYPHLPDELELRFKLGNAKKEWGDVQGALNDYRSIDLRHPGHPIATKAREQIELLRTEGIPVRDYTVTQRISRAELLLRSGPIDLARGEINELLKLSLPASNRSTVAALAAQLARLEGRFEESEVHQQAANNNSDARVLSAEQAQALAEQAQQTAAARAEERIERIVRRRAYVRLSFPQLKAVLEIATNAKLKEPSDKVTQALIDTRRALWPQFRFQMAVLAAGTASDKLVALLLEPMLEDRRYGLAARYHYGRALERQGQNDGAADAFINVITNDKGERKFYRLLAEQRLASMGKTELLAAHEDIQDILSRGQALVAHDRTIRQPTHPNSSKLTAVTSKLESIATMHGDAYPWIPRALDLIRLGEHEAAGDEILEFYRAWRSATGRSDLRIGLSAVYKGRTVRLGWPDAQTRRARMALSAEDRHILADTAMALGDYGTAIGLGGWHRLDSLPRPYYDAVRAAAKERGLDPNLLLAVMRVESVFQKHIISYAGAMGLMQIMPRTGALIANNMGRDDFTIDQLLDPRTNVAFAAWYLSSLLERFNGRLPLALASYNGGPHNVRKWMHRHSPNMPLDAFLEHIPFSQTHRYVRRVLTYYAEYRAQQGLGMIELDFTLPKRSIDTVAF